jgi:hypothetical protein
MPDLSDLNVVYFILVLALVLGLLAWLSRGDKSDD